MKKEEGEGGLAFGDLARGATWRQGEWGEEEGEWL